MQTDISPLFSICNLISLLYFLYTVRYLSSIFCMQSDFSPLFSICSRMSLFYFLYAVRHLSSIFICSQISLLYFLYAVWYLSSSFYMQSDISLFSICSHISPLFSICSQISLLYFLYAVWYLFSIFYMQSDLSSIFYMQSDISPLFSICNQMSLLYLYPNLHKLTYLACSVLFYTHCLREQHPQVAEHAWNRVFNLPSMFLHLMTTAGSTSIVIYEESNS